MQLNQYFIPILIVYTLLKKIKNSYHFFLHLLHSSSNIKMSKDVFFCFETFFSGKTILLTFCRKKRGAKKMSEKKLQ